jgi:hypothetical protein
VFQLFVLYQVCPLLACILSSLKFCISSVLSDLFQLFVLSVCPLLVCILSSSVKFFISSVLSDPFQLFFLKCVLQSSLLCVPDGVISIPVGIVLSVKYVLFKPFFSCLRRVPNGANLSPRKCVVFAFFVLFELCFVFLNCGRFGFSCPTVVCCVSFILAS